METSKYSSGFRRKSKGNDIKQELSTSSCILTLLYHFLRLLFREFRTRSKKNCQRLSTVFCYPVVYLLRLVYTIKWRRILNANRIKKCLKRFFTQFNSFKAQNISGERLKSRSLMQFEFWERKRRNGYLFWRNSYEIDVRNV